MFPSFSDMPLHIACVLYDGFLLPDVAGPIGAFEFARVMGTSGYSITVVASSERAVRSSAGLTINAIDYRDVGACDIVLLPGGISPRDPAAYRGILPFIRESDRLHRRLIALSSGTYVLADAGVLAGRRVVTHWGLATEFRERFPDVALDVANLFLRDGHVWTSAGINSAADVALAVIAEDYGIAAAQRTAGGLLMPYRRLATQSQQPEFVEPATADGRVTEVLAWAQERLHEPLNVERLAGRAALGIRQFARAFQRSTGLSPARAIEHLRVERARAAIEGGARAFDDVAARFGFGNPDRMRRAFLRTIGRTPQQVRRDQRLSDGRRRRASGEG